MKNLKKFASVLVLTLVFAVFAPAMKSSADSADTYDVHLECGNFLNEEQMNDVTRYIETAASNAECNLAVYIVDDLGEYDSEWDYASKMLHNLWGEDSDSTVMVYRESVTDSGSVSRNCGVATSGTAYAAYDKHTLELSTQVISTAIAYDIETAIVSFCGKLETYGERNTSYNNHKNGEEFTNPGGELRITNGEWRAALADFDDCLTDSEEQSVLRNMETTAAKIKCNVGIVITRDLNGMTSRNYAEAFLDDNFGITSDSVVLMLLNTHDNPAYDNAAIYRDWISLSGKAEKRLQKYVNNDIIWDRVYYALDNNGMNPDADFKYACDAFCNVVGTYGSTGFLRVWRWIVEHAGQLFVAAMVGFVVSIVVVYINAKKYRKKSPLNAAQYIDRRTVRLTYQRDDFIREYTTSYRISSSHSGGGGHHSGGGGGGGGHHGGGGGRHR